MPSYPSITSRLCRKLGDETHIGAAQFNAVFRSYFEYYGSNGDSYINPDMVINMSTEDYDPETMNTNAEVHRIKDNTRWLIKETPHVQDGVVIMPLVAKVDEVA